MRGIGRILVVVYGILALAALGRSIFQIATKFESAPLAYSLSAVAAGVYVLATIALVARGRAWRPVAWATIGFELLGVLAIGTFSLIRPELFPEPTVWSGFGIGYLLIPLVLPVLGLLWLARGRNARATADERRAVATGAGE